MTARSAFLAGNRLDDVVLYLADEHLENAGALADRAERVDGGYVLVLDGEAGRALFPKIAGTGAMAFARQAMQAEGRISRDLTGGACPAAGEADEGHDLRFVFAFSQAQDEAVGGQYAKGDVIHAYAQCRCGTAYSDRWVVGERTAE